MNLSMDEKIIEMVNEVFMESFELEEEELIPEATIFEDLGLDSLDVVDLIVALQDKFNVTLRDDERVKNIVTLENLYDFIALIKTEHTC
ncbi:Acyl carrier protein 2 [Desulfamplus magnetovallimortis]|uniref:Acyl carrier protein n=1 Tax=Desulfamplus magnetovallimortis TaxID=1246637 RepID=L0R5H3_9BACT|nr:phosphopantetheine-binding protein [Desulfamplus magnetovallimortis]CCO06775.1 Acyl carrier protein 2 [Desulfamplus magnetovallimortis BW-1]SLM32826.1 Acyl carrier protein 2 [Desulfamplus magnetovallimortis]